LREFEIYTDASSKQLGAVITQGNKPIAFFSRKLTETQQRYSVTEIELLAIVETLKEFKGMLWGQKLKVFTDHKNLIQDALGLTSDRVYRWRLLLEEYGPEIVHIKGIHNTVADAISRLDFGLV
jgi:ribonuclease HI